MTHASDCATNNAPALPAAPPGSKMVQVAPDWVDLVRQWHEAFGVPVQAAPTFDQKRVDLRLDLMEEEMTEFIDACNEEDSVKVLHEAADLIYVILGAMLEFGLGQHLDAAFREVARANMSKLGADGKPIYREDGKVLKGPNFTPADIRAVLDRASVP